MFKFSILFISLLINFQISLANDKIIGIVLSRTDSIDAKESISTDIYGQHGRYSVREHYANAIKELCPDIHLLFLDPNQNSIKLYASMIDGLIIPGNNPDINPTLYGEKPVIKLLTEKYRNEFEIGLIKELYKKQKPILGICAGYQIMNVAFGGTLYQDLPTQLNGKINHNPFQNAEVIAHEIEVKGGILQKITGKQKRYSVNSFHHQGIKKLAEGFTVIAESDDGLTEAIQKTNYPFMVGIQWHPEFQLSKYDTQILQEFCTAVKNEKQKNHIKGKVIK
jgi:gamma-glutamyl-gamma-aminobutyrate hydrolase PuuD